MLLSRTMTAPTNLRSHVDRVETSRAMFMKYSSQETRTRLGSEGSASPGRDGSRESTRRPLGRDEREHKPAPGAGPHAFGRLYCHAASVDKGGMPRHRGRMKWTTIRARGGAWGAGA